MILTEFVSSVIFQNKMEQTKFVYDLKVVIDREYYNMKEEQFKQVNKQSVYKDSDS